MLAKIAGTSYLALPRLFFLLKDVVQTAHMWRNLDNVLVSLLEVGRGLLSVTHASRCARQNDSAGGERGALRQEANEFGAVENHVAKDASADQPGPGTQQREWW